MTRTMWRVAQSGRCCSPSRCSAAALSSSRTIGRAPEAIERNFCRGGDLHQKVSVIEPNDLNRRCNRKWLREEFSSDIPGFHELFDVGYVVCKGDDVRHVSTDTG